MSDEKKALSTHNTKGGGGKERFLVRGRKGNTFKGKKTVSSCRNVEEGGKKIASLEEKCNN